MNTLQICNIIWPWLKEEYIDIIESNSTDENIFIKISFNKLTNFHYLVESIDINIKSINIKPELKIKVHAPYFSPEMKAKFQLDKNELKDKLALIMGDEEIWKY